MDESTDGAFNRGRQVLKFTSPGMGHVGVVFPGGPESFNIVDGREIRTIPTALLNATDTGRGGLLVPPKNSGRNRAAITPSFARSPTSR